MPHLLFARWTNSHGRFKLVRPHVTEPSPSPSPSPPPKVLDPGERSRREFLESRRAKQPKSDGSRLLDWLGRYWPFVGLVAFAGLRVFLRLRSQREMVPVGESDRTYLPRTHPWSIAV